MHLDSCPKCGRAIALSAPKGLCPVCLVGSLFEPVDDPGDLPLPASALEQIGGYELLEQIGRGGMGVVFRARDARLHRIVALKLILTGKLASAMEVKRFCTEAEAAARLDHPNIVPVYEVGESDGRHFFAMNLMDGGNLAERLLDFRDPLSAAKVLGKIARAVHHAHERGVLHRDLKLANILMDGEGEPHVTDFGLARMLQGDSLTVSGAIIGSPTYMAPEQAIGCEPTTAADIYSLGAIFYELLTGRAPFVADNVPALLRKIVDDEPERPSGVGRDLATICLKCLEKEPARRYASAAALADDLERWERHEPILARPVAPAERLVKWARRRPAVAVLLAVCAAALAGFVALQHANETRLTRERDYAKAQERLARENLYAADMFLAHRAVEDGNLALASRRLEAHRPAPGQEDLRGFEWRYLWQQCRGEQQHTFTGFSDAVTCVAFSPDGRQLAAGGGNLVHCWDVADYRLVATFEHEPGCVIRSVCFSPDGKTVWTGDSQGHVRQWEAERSREPVFCMNRGTGIVHVAVSSEWIAIGERDRADGKSRGAVTITDLRRARDSAPHLLTNSGGLAAFAEDGRSLLTAGGTGSLLSWDVATGASRELLYLNEASAIAVSRNGRAAVACAYNTFGLVLVDLIVGTNIWIHREGLGSLGTPALSDDGQTFALACADHTVRVFDTATRRETDRLLGHMAEVLAVAFAPDGETLASCGKDRTVRLWTLGRTNDSQLLTRVFYPYTFSADSRRFFAADDDTPARMFRQIEVCSGRTIPGTESAAPPPCGAKFELPAFLPVRHGLVRAAAKAPDGKSFAIGLEDSTIQLWDFATRTLRATFSGHHDPVTDLVFSPDSRTLASSASQTVKLWHVPTAREVATLTRSGPTLHPLFSPDGTALVACHWPGNARFWRAPTLAEIDGERWPTAGSCQTPRRPESGPRRRPGRRQRCNNAMPANRRCGPCGDAD